MHEKPHPFAPKNVGAVPERARKEHSGLESGKIGMSRPYKKLYVVHYRQVQCVPVCSQQRLFRLVTGCCSIGVPTTVCTYSEVWYS